MYWLYLDVTVCFRFIRNRKFIQLFLVLLILLLHTSKSTDSFTLGGKGQNLKDEDQNPAKKNQVLGIKFMQTYYDELQRKNTSEELATPLIVHMVRTDEDPHLPYYLFINILSVIANFRNPELRLHAHTKPTGILWNTLNAIGNIKVMKYDSF